MDQNTRTLLTEVQIDNRDGQLLPGMFAMVTFPSGSGPAPLLVPGDAIVVRHDQTVVCVVVNGKVRLVPVVIGRDFGLSVEIVSGLREGDVVITNITDDVVEGRSVQTLPNAAKQQSATQKPEQSHPQGASTQNGAQHTTDQSTQGDSQKRNHYRQRTAAESLEIFGGQILKRTVTSRWRDTSFGALIAVVVFIAHAPAQEHPAAPTLLRPAPARQAEPARGNDAQPAPQRVTPPTDVTDPTATLRVGQRQETADKPEQPRGVTQMPDAPGVAPITGVVTTPSSDAALTQTANGKHEPQREAVTGLLPHFLGFLGPYRRPHVGELFGGDPTRFGSLLRNGKLYLTLDDAIALALENNLDVEVERYNLVLATTDIVRAAGGGNLRGIDFTVQQPPNGVGGPGSPLLNAATTSTNPTTPALTDLTSLNSTNQQTQNLSELGTGFQYSPGPSIPLFDPQLIGEAGYLRRSNTVTLTNTMGTTGGSGPAAPQTQRSARSPGKNAAFNAPFVRNHRRSSRLTFTAHPSSAGSKALIAARSTQLELEARINGGLQSFSTSCLTTMKQPRFIFRQLISVPHKTARGGGGAADRRGANMRFCPAPIAGRHSEEFRRVSVT